MTALHTTQTPQNLKNLKLTLAAEKQQPKPHTSSWTEEEHKLECPPLSDADKARGPQLLTQTERHSLPDAGLTTVSQETRVDPVRPLCFFPLF